MKKALNPLTQIGSCFQLKLPNKIKIILEEKKIKQKRSDATYPDKIIFSVGETKTTKIKIPKISKDTPKKLLTIKKKRAIHDRDLYKSFNKYNFSKLDLHGYYLDDAKKKLFNYCNVMLKRGNTFHIIITGLGNKPSNDGFFSGKIRNSFVEWINSEELSEKVHSYSQCKVYHGGLGAFYLKLRSIK